MPLKENEQIFEESIPWTTDWNFLALINYVWNLPWSVHILTVMDARLFGHFSTLSNHRLTCIWSVKEMALFGSGDWCAICKLFTMHTDRLADIRVVLVHGPLKFISHSIQILSKRVKLLIEGTGINLLLWTIRTPQYSVHCESLFHTTSATAKTAIENRLSGTYPNCLQSHWTGCSFRISCNLRDLIL